MFFFVMILLAFILVGLANLEASASILHLSCLNPVIESGVFEDKRLSPDWRLIQVHTEMNPLTLPGSCSSTPP